MNRNIVRSLRIGTTAFLMSFLVNSASAQCILCRETLKSGGSKELITGFIFSTLLLTAVPVTLLCVFTFVIYRSIQRQKSLPEDFPADDESSIASTPSSAP